MTKIYKSLSNAESNITIPRPKIESYSLKPGTKHYPEFVDVGYTSNDTDLLLSHINKQLKINEAEQRIDEYGNTVYDVYIHLGVTTKKTFIAGFQKDKGSNITRLVTLYRRNKNE